MCQAQIKTMATSLLEELQSSVPPCPRYGPVGGRRLKSGLFNRYVIVVISELFRHNHADRQSVTPVLAHDPSVHYSTAPRPKRSGFKYEKNSRKGCDTFEKKTSGLLNRRASNTFSLIMALRRLKRAWQFLCNFIISSVQAILCCVRSLLERENLKFTCNSDNCSWW